MNTANIYVDSMAISTILLTILKEFNDFLIIRILKKLTTKKHELWLQLDKWINI